MRIPVARRLEALGSYAFAAVKEAVARLEGRGIDVIDFGVGDHTLPSPEVARERLKVAVDEHASSGYPPYVGMASFRRAACAWMERRFGVALDADSQVCSTIGSKEGVFNFPEAFVDPGDVVLIPSPGYPPYTRGTQFAEGTPVHLPLTAASNWLVDFNTIPNDVADKAKLAWICYPNSPSGAMAPVAFLERAIGFCREHDILLCSDEAYSEIYYDDSNLPHSALELAGPQSENVVAFFSMSKRSMMTGWRIGWVCGDAAAIAAFKKLKTNIDSGTPAFIQEGAIKALEDEAHVEAMRAATREKREVLADALVALGLPDCRPEATLYHWQRVPDGMTSVQFAQALLADDVAIVCTPGAWISDECRDPRTGETTNPGEGYVRFALVPPIERIRLAAERLRNAKL